MTSFAPANIVDPFSPAGQMQLLYTKFSPFSRKVLVLSHERGLISKIEAVAAEVGTHVPLDTPAHAALSARNPLMKVPALVLENGETLYDSRTICEYLDSLHGGEPVFPADKAARWQALRLQAIGDGIVDAAIMLRFEDARPSPKWPEWQAAQTRRILQSLDQLEREAKAFPAPLDIGQIAVGCALGYLDFRFGHLGWRNGRPLLAAWFEAFGARPSMRATAPA
jgi:glutathione S-transferase